MTVEQITQELNLTILAGKEGLTNEVTGGYVSDLMSDVMGHADSGQVWITLQTHKNVIAIASLKDLAAVILVKDFAPEPAMLEQANEEGIPILGTNESTFEITAKLYQLISK